MPNPVNKKLTRKEASDKELYSRRCLGEFYKEKDERKRNIR